MAQTIKAIYRNGFFIPLEPISANLSEGGRVWLTIAPLEDSAREIMKLAENFYEGLSEEEVDEIEKIALDRSNFFGGIKP